MANGIFTSAGVSDIFTPFGSSSAPGFRDILTPFGPVRRKRYLQGPHAPFGVKLSGAYTSGHFLLTRSINGAPFALMFGPDGKSPLQLHSPGQTVITESNYTAPGDAPPSYQIVCKTVKGECAWAFNQ
jgi:hypothetical protein